MSDDPSGRMPAGWYTDDRGNFHWGTPADTARRLADQALKLEQAGAEERARRAAISREQISRFGRSRQERGR